MKGNQKKKKVLQRFPKFSGIIAPAYIELCTEKDQMLATGLEERELQLGLNSMSKLSPT